MGINGFDVAAKLNPGEPGVDPKNGAARQWLGRRKKFLGAKKRSPMKDHFRQSKRAGVPLYQTAGLLTVAYKLGGRGD